jgi:hypothetical protein
VICQFNAFCVLLLLANACCRWNLACSLQTFSSLQLFGAGPSSTMHSILPLSLSLESCHHICSTDCGQLVSQLQGCVLALRGMAGDRQNSCMVQLTLRSSSCPHASLQGQRRAWETAAGKKALAQPCSTPQPPSAMRPASSC